nr:hypothetical protein GCM10025732_49920 [Glycomyces mayteni]
MADDPSQYAEDLDPAAGLGDRVLHCGYYGPGSKYLMIETYRWPSAAEAVAGVEGMRADREADPLYEVTPFEGESSAGYTTAIGQDDLEYATAYDELVVLVSISDAGVGTDATEAAGLLSVQSWELFTVRG